MGLKQKIKQIMPEWAWKEIKGCQEKYYEKQMKIKCKSVEKFRACGNPYGVNLMGDIRAETGLGQSMRIVAEMLDAGKVPFVVRQVNAPDNIEHQERNWDYKIASENKYGINIIHINNNVWKKNYSRMQVSELSGRYNIAYWLWELEEFPAEWVSCIDTVDEIWTPSEFISRGIRKKTKKPVMTMPYGMHLEDKNLFRRDHFFLPEDTFLFLVMYDFLSISERKNPYGAIQAYMRAFKPTDAGVGLVVKANHLGDKRKLERLREELKEYPNIYFITDNLGRREVESLIAAADVLVSLHRAEGFGLPLAEAMYLKTAVIATGWSSTTEFMDADSACLVDYNLIALDRDIGPYHKGNRWADADVGQAAEHMRNLWKDKEFYSRKVAHGAEHIKTCLDMEKMSDRMVQRIQEIYKRGTGTSYGQK